MGHDHHGHSHGPSADADRKWLTIALVLIAGFMVVEVVVGIIASSLALLSDAAHMLTDAGAIGAGAGRGRRSPRGRRRKRYTFGLGRAEILSAQANGATLLVLAGVLAIEAIRRLFDPPDVEGGARDRRRRARRVREHRRGAGRSRAASGAGSTSRARWRTCSPTSTARWRRSIAGVIIVTTGFGAGGRDRGADRLGADAALGLAAAARLRPDPARGLAEGHRPRRGRPRARRAPTGSSRSTTCTCGRSPRASRRSPAHVLVAEGDDCHARRGELERLLHDRFGIDHTTLQVDHEHAPRLLDISPGARALVVTYRSGPSARARPR